MKKITFLLLLWSFPVLVFAQRILRHESGKVELETDEGVVIKVPQIATEITQFERRESNQSDLFFLLSPNSIIRGAELRYLQEKVKKDQFYPLTKGQVQALLVIVKDHSKNNITEFSLAKEILTKSLVQYDQHQEANLSDTKLSDRHYLYKSLGKFLSAKPVGTSEEKRSFSKHQFEWAKLLLVHLGKEKDQLKGGPFHEVGLQVNEFIEKHLGPLAHISAKDKDDMISALKLYQEHLSVFVVLGSAPVLADYLKQLVTKGQVDPDVKIQALLILEELDPTFILEERAKNQNLDNLVLHSWNRAIERLNRAGDTPSASAAPK